MFGVFLGQFLLNEGVLSTNELNRLLEISKSTKVKIGVLAINSGLMTADNVNKVNMLQGRVDKKLGEIAIEEGYLTETELDMLLNVQFSEHLKLTQTLIDEKICTYDEVENYLAAYKSKYSLNDDQFEDLRNGKVKTIIDTYLKFDNEPFADLFKEYISLFYKSVTRFIDSVVRVEEVNLVDSNQYDFIVKQEIIGPKRIYTAFAGETDSMIKFSSRFADETFNSLDDYAQDTLGEFLNLANGLYLVNLSDYGVDLNLSIQSLAKNYIVDTNKVYAIPFYLSFGKIDLLLSLNPIT